MTALLADDFSRRLPNQVEIENADQLRRIIASVTDDGEGATLNLSHGKGRPAEAITLTPSIAKTLTEVLRLISSGSGFVMIPVTARLTTQQAADLLNVSRPHFVKLLEEGAMPFEKVGRHRRVRAEDLFAYMDERDRRRDALLAEMAAADAEAGLL